MSTYRVKDNGQEPVHWKVEKFADIPFHDWVRNILDLRPVVDAGTFETVQDEKIKEAMMAIVIEGLMPAYLELEEIRKLRNSNVPILNRQQPFEDLARKLWKAYKELTQSAARLIGFNIGFLFQDDAKFAAGLKKIREDNPNLRVQFEDFLTSARSDWQNDLSQFRNSFLEHQGGQRKDFEWFYKPKNAQVIFDAVSITIGDLLPMLLETKLEAGVNLIEQHPDDPGPRWPQRFKYEMTGLKTEQS